jgi:hypothetical protein
MKVCLRKTKNYPLTRRVAASNEAKEEEKKMN